MDKLTIFLSAANQFKRFVVAGSCLLAAACAASGQGERPEQTPAESEQVRLHIATAERLVDIGEYDSALDEYLAAARISTDPEVSRTVTRVAARVQDWEAAAAAAGRWLELEPQAESAHHVRILALVNQERMDESLNAMQQWLGLDSQPSEHRYWRRGAMLLTAATNEQAARVAMSRLAERAGDQAPAGEVQHARSLLLWRQGDEAKAYDEALAAAEASKNPGHLEWAAQLAVEREAFEQALSLYREAGRQDGEARISRTLAEAEVLRQLGRDEEAIELLAALPERSDSLYTLGVYLVQLDRRDRAESVWKRLADLPDSGRSPNHAFLVGQLAELVHRDEDALAWYARVADGESAQQATMRRAVVLGRLDRIEEARTLLAKIREDADDERVHETWLVEAEILRSAGHPEAAIEFLAEPLAERPGSVDLLYARALSAALAGDIDLAEQDLRRIIQMDGDNAMALNALGYTLADQTNRYQEAYRLVRRALELDPDDAATLDSMGWVLYRLGRAEEAVDYLERALEGDENPEIMAHLIEVLDHLGRSDEAERLADRALADHADDAYLASTLERLGYQ